VARELEDQADESWLWKGKFHAKLIDANLDENCASNAHKNTYVTTVPFDQTPIKKKESDVNICLIRV